MRAWLRDSISSLYPNQPWPERLSDQDQNPDQDSDHDSDQNQDYP
ncbi:MAG TPA: hypothetical protein VFA08_08195 [Actinomycetota bacterium]|nr:hypothetical protein [Actinomycetota bacterium]